MRAPTKTLSGLGGCPPLRAPHKGTRVLSSHAAVPGAVRETRRNLSLAQAQRTWAGPSPLLPRDSHTRANAARSGADHVGQGENWTSPMLEARSDGAARPSPPGRPICKVRSITAAGLNLKSIQPAGFAPNAVRGGVTSDYRSQSIIIYDIRPQTTVRQRTALLADGGFGPHGGGPNVPRPGPSLGSRNNVDRSGVFACRPPRPPRFWP